MSSIISNKGYDINMRGSDRINAQSDRPFIIGGGEADIITTSGTFAAIGSDIATIAITATVSGGKQVVMATSGSDHDGDDNILSTCNTTIIISGAGHDTINTFGSIALGDNGRVTTLTSSNYSEVQLIELANDDYGNNGDQQQLYGSDSITSSPLFNLLAGVRPKI
jgi:hypothetical protein